MRDNAMTTIAKQAKLCGQKLTEYSKTVMPRLYFEVKTAGRRVNWLAAGVNSGEVP